ncbi:hypothetical protein BKA62DRAFT_61806 [Auriculariales sp. MPI-PUGE-AT-0066]|nr:hypothetical protein BKA62DRAFT_61806 [Auriculariales sp. MPI-PUGE-AT-0066]
MKYICAVLLCALGTTVASIVAGGPELADFTARAVVEKRATPGYVYTCTGATWAGTCTSQKNALSTCVVLSSPYSANISSIGPDAGAICTVYTGTTCTSSCSDPYPLSLVYPGVTALGSWDKLIKSFKCVAA